MSGICCICIKKSVFIQNINECIFGTVKYVEKLNTCFPNEVWDESFIICNDCVDKLDGAYSFTQLCLQSQEWRKDQIELKHALLIKPKGEDRADFTCTECGKSFRLKRTLGLHMTRIHTRPQLNVKSESDIQSEVKKENNQPEGCLEVEENLENGDKNEVKLENCKGSTQQDRDVDNLDDKSCSTGEDAVKEKKPAKEKKQKLKKRKGPFQCDFCELVFVETRKLLHHIRSKHTFEKPFKCNLCDAKYLMQRYLNVHMRKHTNEKPYMCSTCGKSFISSNALWKHSKSHDVVRQYPCDKCDRSFKTSSNLRNHKLQMHQDPGVWKFICTVCGKKFPLNSTLVKHMRRHEGIKQFSCHLCQKKFVEKIELQNHLLSHSNERNCKCHVCGKAYKKSDKLKKHLKVEHDVGNFAVKKPEKQFSCPMCPKLFEVSHKLQRHILTHAS